MSVAREPQGDIAEPVEQRLDISSEVALSLLLTVIVRFASEVIRHRRQAVVGGDDDDAILTIRLHSAPVERAIAAVHFG